MDISLSVLGIAGQRYLQSRLACTYLNMDAIFADETKEYVNPYDPDPGNTVCFRLRTAKNNVDAAFLHIVDGSDISESDTFDSNASSSFNSIHGNPQNIPMVKTDQDELFDYYSARYTVGSHELRYYFSIENTMKDTIENIDKNTDKNTGNTGNTGKNNVCNCEIKRRYFYNKKGLHEGADPAYNFKIIPGFRTPDWAKGAVMYQIFVDRFYNGDKTNDPLDHEYLYIGRVARAFNWDEPVLPDDVCNFYGGDLQGIIDKMGYLSSLGIEAIYLNPIFVSPSSHKYDIQDYDYVDPHFGVIKKDEGSVLTFDDFSNRYATKYMSRTADKVNLQASNELLIKMVEAAHRHGIKVILDGVFNHCGSFNKWLDKAGFYKTMGYPGGAYAYQKSPYHNYFLWYDRNWPNNDCYDSWWGNDNHPKLNYEDAPELYEYIMEVGRKWVSPPYNADGWRLDVAADLGRSPEFNHKFWQDFRKAVKSANPNAIILAEHYGDVSPWISGGEWDTVMNYDAFMEPLTWFLTGMNKHSEEHLPHLKGDAFAFESAMRYYMARFNIHALSVSMNQLSNHDHSRFLTRTSGQTGRLHTKGPAAAEEGVNKSIMMEAVVFQMTWPGAPTIYYGDEAGMTGWTDPDNRRPFPWGKEDKVIMELHQEAIALRKKYPVLRYGSTEFLWNEHGLISFGRWNKKEQIAVILNNNPWTKEIRLPVWKMGIRSGTMRQILATHQNKVHKDIQPFTVESGTVALTMPGYSSMVLVIG